MAKDRVRPYTYSAGLKDLQVMLKRVSPDDTDFTLHGVRVMGWNRAAADNAALAERRSRSATPTTTFTHTLIHTRVHTRLVNRHITDKDTTSGAITTT
jgi:hypothetical protein